jgi:hypothetical protein
MIQLVLNMLIRSMAIWPFFSLTNVFVYEYIDMDGCLFLVGFPF